MGGQGANVRPVSSTLGTAQQGQLADQRSSLQQQMSGYGNLQAPSQSSTSLAQAVQAAPTQIAPTQQSNATLASVAKNYFDGLAQSGASKQQGQQQNELISALQQAAAGNGPSMAGQTIGSGVAASLAAQNAAAASQTGMNAGTAMRQGQQQAAATQAQGAVAAGQAKIQEQQAATGQLGNVLAQARAQNLALDQANAQMMLQNGQFNAGAANQANLANAAAQTANSQYNAGQGNAQSLAQAQLLQQLGLANAGASNQANLANAGASNQAAANNLQAQLATRQLSAQQQLALQQLLAGNTQQSWGIDSGTQDMRTDINKFNAGASDRGDAATRQTVGQVGQAAVGVGMMMSDERAKTDIHDASKTQIRDLLHHVRPHVYRYKDPTLDGAGDGEFLSPMAQELERTELGRSMVETGDDGYKRVNYGRGLGAILAATAHMHDRIESLERKRGK